MADFLPSGAVPDLVRELTRARRPESETRVFAIWRHDADLLPKLESRLNSLMAAIKKHPADVYDIQGRRDEGADVFVKRTGESVICFQVKADYELDEPDIVEKLRLQYTRTLESYRPLQQYYILVCADLTGKGSGEGRNPPERETKRTRTALRAQRRRQRSDEEVRAKKRQRVLRSINELARIPDITVVQPTAALGMLRLSDAHLDALVSARFSSADSVFAEARAILRSLRPAQRAILARLAWDRVFGHTGGKVRTEDLARDPAIAECYAANPQLGYIPFAEHEWETITQSDDAQPEHADEDEEGDTIVFTREGYDPSAFDGTNEERRRLALNDDEARIETDLDALDGSLISTEDDAVELISWPAKSLIAVLVDGVVRYGHDSAASAAEYLLSFS